MFDIPTSILSLPAYLLRQGAAAAPQEFQQTEKGNISNELSCPISTRNSPYHRRDLFRGLIPIGVGPDSATTWRRPKLCCPGWHSGNRNRSSSDLGQCRS